MARHTFGGDVASLAVSVAVNKSLSANNGVAVTFADAQTGGSSVTDLLAADGVTPITSVTSGSDGTLPVFYGPDETTQLWAIVPGAASRRLILATDVSTTYVPFSPVAYGVTFDGVTDDAAAWNSLFTAMAAAGWTKPIKALAGTSLNKSQWNPPAGFTLDGAGVGRTVIKFQNTGATLGGIRCANDMTIKNATVQVDVNAQTWCAGYIVSQACSNVVFDTVKFLGTTTKTGNYAGWISSANADNVRHINCTYDTLTFGIAKDNADTSAQENWHWDKCTATNCTDIININSPAGSWTNGSIDMHVSTISQYPVAFAGANCAHWDVRVTGHDTEYELVHVESGAWDIDAHVSGYLCNKTAGVVGNGAAINGMVQVITGAHDVRVTGDMDLTQNTTGSPNGLVVQGGGGTVPWTVSLSAHIKLKAGCEAVFAQNVGLADTGVLDLSDCTFENTAASKSASILELPGTITGGGNNRFINPGVVLKIDDNSFIGLRDSVFHGDLSTLAFTTGSTSVATRVVFQNFQLKRPFTVDSTAAWQTICPDGSLYDGIIALRYAGNGAADSFTKTARLTGKVGTLTIASEQSNAVGGVDPNPGPTNFQSSAGNLQTKCYRATTQTGTLIATFQGAWFA